MYLFYNSTARTGSSVIIDPSEATHLVKALRKKDGDEVDLTDGRGMHFKARISISGSKVSAQIFDSKQVEKAGPRLEIAVAPTKNQERLEWFIEKAIEIGIERITLIQCDHSERTHIRAERLERVAIAAMKQSLRFYLPAISSPIPFSEWLSQVSSQQKMIAHCNEKAERTLLQKLFVKGSDSVIAIGPEGDFSQREIESAIESGFDSASLGDARLRTETAALCAVHTFALLNQ